VQAKIRVAASNTDLASIASSVGGEEVETFSIARPTADAHHVEVLPSYMVKVSRAQVYLKVGLGLDQWADQIIDGSRNARLAVVDCSVGIPVLEKPTGQVNASMGDVHPNGNPHYWLDPRNGGIVAGTVAEALSKVDPAHAADFRARAEAFAKETEAAWTSDKAMADQLPAKVIITYHRSWTYFGNAFGIEIAAEAEPVPGIPPTGKHLAELVDIVKSRKVPVFIQEPYFSNDAGEFLQREGGLRVVVIAPSCDSPAAGSYLSHFRDVLSALVGGKEGS
jgi:zinc/manganese transport system substrate-binding protein